VHDDRVTASAKPVYVSDSIGFEDDEEEAPDLLRVSLTLAQADAFAKRTAAVVGAGRLPCPFCGIPIDPTGHLCPRANGYRR
jgi:uncharacterized repeat protein (TIGR03847 family)